VIDFGERVGVPRATKACAASGGMVGGTGLFMRHLVTNVMIEHATADRAERFSATSSRSPARAPRV